MSKREFETGNGHTMQAHTYVCVDCAMNVTATSRPDGCPECGGSLHNATLDRSAGDDSTAGVAFTYECVENGRQLTADERPVECPVCKGPVRNVTLERR